MTPLRQLRRGTYTVWLLAIRSAEHTGSGGAAARDVTCVICFGRLSAQAQNADAGACGGYVSIIYTVPPVPRQEGDHDMASLIAIATGVALVFAAISVPYQDSWYGRWSRSDR
jgi:hypothetical protein